MMAKAHVVIGMAAAIAALQPQSVPEALPAIAGAAAGCLICDIDCDVAAEKKDSSRWRMIMAFVVIAVLIEDYLIGGGMWAGLMERGASHLWFFGLAGFALACTFAGISEHRGFSHSLLAMIWEAASIWMIFPSMTPAFIIAFLTHICLDLLNKKPVRILYPVRKGWCLGLFYADRTANKLFAAAGILCLIAELALFIRR